MYRDTIVVLKINDRALCVNTPKTRHMHITYVSYMSYTRVTLPPQLPHSYYFTTHILVLKFVNKGVFFEEIQDFIFLEKGGILVLTSVNLVKNGLILMSSVLPCKRGFIRACVLPQKGGSFWTEKSVLSRKRGHFELKSQFLPQKGGHFQTGEQGWVPLFAVSEGARTV